MQRITRLIALASLLLSIAFCPLLAQEKTSLRGVVRDGGSNNGIGGVLVTLQSSNQQTTTESDGSFAFYNIKAGEETLLFSSPLHTTVELNITITPNRLNEVGPIVMIQNKINDNAQFAGIVDNIDLDQIDDEGAGQSANTMVIFTNDVYLQKAGFQFSQFRHRNRGYDNTYEQRYINGINFNEGVRGDACPYPIPSLHLAYRICSCRKHLQWPLREHNGHR